MFNHLNIHNLPELDTKQSATGRRYYKTPDGEWYPSITTILGVGEKPWIKNWQKMLGTKKANKEKNRCAERGTAIHLMSEKYLNNEEIDTKQYTQEYINDFNKLKFRLNKIDNIRGQEIPLYSDKLKAAGRVDCVGEYDGVLSIIDFKTSTNNKYREWIYDYFLQTTAYAIMWYERTGEPIEEIRILMTVEKGMMPMLFKDKIDNYVGPLIKRIRESENELQKHRRTK